MMLDDNIPSHSIEAEQSLIGALMLDNTAFDRIDSFDPADCYSDAHRVVLTHIVRMLADGKPVDVLTVLESLSKTGDVERVGGLAYLGDIANNTPSAANIRRYAEIVREKAIIRALVSAGAEIQTLAMTADGATVDDRVNAAASRINAIAEGQIKASGPVSMVDAASEAVAHLQSVMDGQIRRYQTGLIDLDHRLYSYAPGCVVIIAGRPGMGKTSLAMQAAELCADDDVSGAVAVFSLEMPRKELMLRTISRKGDIPLTNVVSANMTELEWTNLSGVLARATDSRMYIDDTPGLNIAQLRARCNVIRRKAGGIKLIVIDYMQLMSGDKKAENRTQEIGGISRGLKRLAKEFNVPVIALSQLSRKLEDRPNKRPHMADLRESGDIEQDADLILFVYRDEIYNPDSQDKGTAEIIIGKQRNGPSGESARVSWAAEIATFKNLDLHAWHESRAEAPVPEKKSRRGFA